MDENNTAQAGNETQATEAKTFSQDELNKIVQERVAKERAKFEGYEELKEKAAKFDEQTEASKTELQKATEKAEKLEAELKSLKKAEAVNAVRTKVAEETKVPASLLTGSTEEECKAQAQAILEFANANGYPEVKDGGEARTTANHSTADQFADWMKKQLT